MCGRRTHAHLADDEDSAADVFLPPLTSHEDYANSNDAVEGGTALNNVERAYNADDVAVQTMRPYEILKSRKQNKSLRKKGWNERNESKKP